MFSVHPTPEEFEHTTISAILDLCLRKTRAGKSRDYRDVIAFEELRFQNVFRPRTEGESREINLVPRVSHFTASWSELAPGGGKMRDPGNEVPEK